MSESTVPPNASVTETAPGGHGRSNGSLTEALEQIARLQELDADWDLDGARSIDQQATRLASFVVRALVEMAAQGGVHWQQPEIGPVPDGSVVVTWESNNRDTLMVFRPDQATRVECVTQEKGAGPIQQVVSEAEAVRLALWTLGAALPGIWGTVVAAGSGGNRSAPAISARRGRVATTASHLPVRGSVKGARPACNRSRGRNRGAAPRTSGI